MDRGFSYQAFFSYSTDPDYALARDVERYLESLHLRNGLKPLQLRKLEICRDGSDFRLPANRSSEFDDPIRAILDVYLRQSEYLVVLCSRRATQSPHVAYEIQNFLDRQLGDRILLLVTEGDDPSNNPEEVVPASLISAGLHRHPFYDVRGMRKGARRTEAKVRDWEEELVRLADDLHGSKEGTVYPAWVRRRDLIRRRWEFAASAAAVLIVLAGAGWQWTRTNTFQLNHLLSETSLEALTEGRSLTDYAVALARAGRVIDAEKVIAASQSAEMRAEATAAVAAVLREAGPGIERATGKDADPDLDPLDPLAIGNDRGDLIIDEMVSGGGAAELQQLATADDRDTLQYIARKLVSKKQPHEALRVARMIRDNYDDKKVQALLEVAASLDRNEALPLLEEAWQLVKGDVASLAHADLASGFLKVNAADRAEEVLAAAPGSWPDFTMMALWYADHGDMTRAREEIKKTSPQSDARKSMITHLLQKGRDTDALSIAEDSDLEHGERLTSRVDIAKYMYQAKRTTEATELLRRAWQSFDANEEHSSFAWLWRLDFVEAMAEGGDEAIAHDLVNRLVDDALHRHNSSQAEDGISVLLTLGKPAEALALFDRLPDVHDREKALSTIALSFEKIGDADSALKAAHRLEHPADTCFKLVSIFAAAMQIQRAREAAACTNLWANSAAIQALIRANHPAEAVAWLDSVTDKEEKLRLIKDSSPDLAEKGQTAEAERLVNLLAPDDQAVILAKMAAKLKDPSRRHAIAEKSVSISSVPLSEATGTWINVARDLVEADEPDLAFVAAKRLTEDRYRSEALIMVAALFAKHKRMADARSTVLLLPDSTARARATVDVLKGWNGETPPR